MTNTTNDQGTASPPRPTAWAILYDNLDPVSPGDLDRALDALADHGYVIVHPADVPRRKVWPDNPSPWEENGDDQARGWNACKAHIFGRAERAE